VVCGSITIVHCSFTLPEVYSFFRKVRKCRKEMEDEFYVSTDIMKQKYQTCWVCHSSFLCVDQIWLLTALYKLFFFYYVTVKCKWNSQVLWNMTPMSLGKLDW
jgi:hypothetical protein